ncbi:hypothetical protein [Paenibacillus dendritiformis]|uniref:DUF2642 domain-containing protein n=1 Tax=Paenibacillus dendritiformis C454 TaxID=1131935 RepID=H3SA11_9BACL|nr:hypothetical protein [Paenibacillus dendritiformis]EHQ64035.1 hypothetical protein PDENDC454_01720 [Paenibacillus dendritiformis C454]CAH8771763.1 hypothetical protein H7S4_004498 [Paenibacillus dendritiformis]
MSLWFGYGRLERKVRHLEEKVEELARGIDEVASGVVPNQELRRFLEFKVGTEIVVCTPSAAVRGVLLSVGSGVLQLRETAGARAIIPFAKVTYVQ